MSFICTDYTVCPVPHADHPRCPSCKPWEPCHVCHRTTSGQNDDGVPICGSCADIGCEVCLIGLPEVEIFGGALVCRNCQQAQIEGQYE